MLESFFLYGDLPPNIEKGHYDLPLVALSYAVATFASYTALSLAQQLTSAQGREKRFLHLGGAFAMGAGIWSMHFIGMLSYKMRMAVVYDPFITLFSMLIAIAVAYGALAIVAREKLSLWQILSGGVLLGFGICAMHYTGMAAMQMDGDLLYIPNIFLLSVAIAIAASAAALWMAFNLARHSSTLRTLFQLIAALIMGAAICGMHYTGMWASVMIPFADCRYDPDQNFTSLAMAVGGITAVILGIALAVGIYRKEQAELRLQSSEARLRAMINNALDAVVAMDQQGRITEWNKQAEAIFGWSYEEAVGQVLSDIIIPPESRHAHQEGMQRFFTQGIGSILNRRVEVTAINRLGEKFPVELAVTAYKLHSTHHFTAFLRDVSDRKQAETTKNLLATIVESSDDPIISRNLDGIITSWNAAAHRLFGYTAEEAIDHHIHLIIPEERLEEERLIMSQLRTGKGIEHFETVRVTKDGESINISLTVSPIRDASGRIIGASKIMHDIRERKQIEARLKSTLQEVTAAKRDAEEAQKKAEQANLAKSEFLANMSHEIRTPLNTIIGTSELLSFTSLNQDQSKFAEALTAAGNMLLALINNILDFSKIESGAIHIAHLPMKVKTLLEEVEQVLTEPAKSNGITLRVISLEGLPTLLGDPVRIKQVMLNLAGNAIKFSNGGTVTLRADFLKRAGETVWLRFSVEDSGHGIPADKLDLIFEKFTQLDEFSTKKYAGTGLGLAICKRLVERMGGTIDVKSEVGKGSLFWFNLPFDVIGKEESAMSEIVLEKPVSSMKTKKKSTANLSNRVLLVEDYPPNRLMTKKMLEQLGCNVDAAQNGEEALDILEKGRYDLVLMDCQMPEMDGFQTTAEIRKREKGRHTIIIAVTAHVLSGDRERCLEKGMDDYISKPIRSAELSKILERYLGS